MSEMDLSAKEALIHIMVLMSAADRQMTDAEMKRIGDQVRNLPIFRDFDDSLLVVAAERCAEILNSDDGLDKVLDAVEAALPKRLGETGYALACEIAVADLNLQQEELRLLEMLRDRLSVDKLGAAAIERGVRARHMTL